MRKLAAASALVWSADTEFLLRVSWATSTKVCINSRRTGPSDVYTRFWRAPSLLHRGIAVVLLPSNTTSPVPTGQPGAMPERRLKSSAVVMAPAKLKSVRLTRRPAGARTTHGQSELPTRFSVTVRPARKPISALVSCPTDGSHWDDFPIRSTASAKTNTSDLAVTN